MLSAVLNSVRAIQMSVLIIRAFVRLREVLASNQTFARPIESIESKVEYQGSAIRVLVEEIKTIKQTPTAPKRRIGFIVEDSRRTRR